MFSDSAKSRAILKAKVRKEKDTLERVIFELHLKDSTYSIEEIKEGTKTLIFPWTKEGV